MIKTMAVSHNIMTCISIDTDYSCKLPPGRDYLFPYLYKIPFVPHLCFGLKLKCGTNGINPFPNDKILDTSKLKEFADDKFNIDGNG